MKGVEDELQTDEAEGMHAQQERNEHEAACMDKRGEFICSGLLTLTLQFCRFDCASDSSPLCFPPVRSWISRVRQK